MSAPSRGHSSLPETDTECWDCGHEIDEHVGASGSCIAYVIQFGLEKFCLCRCFTPSGD